MNRVHSVYIYIPDIQPADVWSHKTSSTAGCISGIDTSWSWFILFQANELNQIVSKAFKVHFASKTIGRQRKEIVKQSPQSSRSHRSPSPQPQSPPPYNPDIVGGGASQPVARTGEGGARGIGGASSQPWTPQVHVYMCMWS